MDKKRVSLLFPKSIYRLDTIKRGIHDYRSICTIDIKELESSYACFFSDSVADLTLTAYEFSNYVIELSNVWSGKLCLY